MLHPMCNVYKISYNIIKYWIIFIQIVKNKHKQYTHNESVEFIYRTKNTVL